MHKSVTDEVYMVELYISGVVVVILAARSLYSRMPKHDQVLEVPKVTVLLDPNKYNVMPPPVADIDEDEHRRTILYVPPIPSQLGCFILGDVSLGGLRPLCTDSSPINVGKLDHLCGKFGDSGTGSFADSLGAAQILLSSDRPLVVSICEGVSDLFQDDSPERYIPEFRKAANVDRGQKPQTAKQKVNR